MYEYGIINENEDEIEYDSCSSEYEYRCTSCNRQFNKTKRIYYEMEEHGIDWIDTCPYCGSESISENDDEE